MAELTKVRRVIAKQMPDAPHETLLTVDATTGQNGVRQAQALLARRSPSTGIVLTKLDGTAKGGIALAIANELGIPVKLIGIGEQLEDLRPFDADDFARALRAARRVTPGVRGGTLRAAMDAWVIWLIAAVVARRRRDRSRRASSSPRSRVGALSRRSSPTARRRRLDVQAIVFVVAHARVLRARAPDRPRATCARRRRSAPAPRRWSGARAIVLERDRQRRGRRRASASTARSGPPAPTTRTSVIEPGTPRRRSSRSRARPRSSPNEQEEPHRMAGTHRRSIVLVALRRCSWRRGRSGSSRRPAPASSSGSAATSRTLDPGLTLVVPFVDRVKPLIDLREQVVTLPAAAGDHRGQRRRSASTRSSTSRSPTRRPRPTRSPTRCRRSSSSRSRRCAT